MSTTTNDNVIVIDDEPDGRIEVACYPFEPHDSGYAGERFLAFFYRAEEEAFVVLTSDQAAHLADLLTQAVTR